MNKTVKTAFQFLCLFVLLAQLFAACVNPRYALNDEERNYVSRNSFGDAEVSIYYDDKAIRKFKDNGVYTVKVEARNGIIKDTNLVKQGAMKIADYVKRIMNFKEHYRYIDVIVTGSYYYGYARAYISEYRYEVRMPLADLSRAKLIQKFLSENLPINGREDAVAPLPRPAPVPVSRYGF